MVKLMCVIGIKRAKIRYDGVPQACSVPAPPQTNGEGFHRHTTMASLHIHSAGTFDVPSRRQLLSPVLVGGRLSWNRLPTRPSSLCPKHNDRIEKVARIHDTASSQHETSSLSAVGKPGSDWAGSRQATGLLLPAQEYLLTLYNLATRLSNCQYGVEEIVRSALVHQGRRPQAWWQQSALSDLAD